MVDQNFLLVVYSVVFMTLLWASSALAIVRFGPSPPTPFSERLFDTFVALTAAGFYTVLGLLATHAH
jgi:hypothetical protein